MAMLEKAKRSVVVVVVSVAWFALVAQAAPPAQESVQLKVTKLADVSYTQMWMREPFTVDVWWGGRLHSEAKGDDFGIGASYKVDLPAPAWIGLTGRENGVVVFSAIPKLTDSPPVSNVTAIDGGANLVEVLSDTPTATLPPAVTPTLTNTPTATATLPPGVTPSPTAMAVPWWERECKEAPDIGLLITTGSTIRIIKRAPEEKTCFVVVKVSEEAFEDMMLQITETLSETLDVGVYAP
jgi:hypothetical protein